MIRAQQTSRRQEQGDPGRSRYGQRRVKGRRAAAQPLALLALFACASLGDSPALAQKRAGLVLEESDRLPSVQNRLYRVEHELNLGVGVLPVDPFYKSIALGGGYAWHFSDIWAAELHGAYLRNVNTDLRDKLEKNFGVPKDRFAEMLYYGGLGVIFKPLYGKLSFLNRPLVYGDLYVSLSAVVGRMVGHPDPSDEKIHGERLAFGGAPGFGVRGYLSKRFSLRFDFRYLILYSDGDMYYPLALTLNLAFTTRSDL